jgi:hypothetical protein
MKARAPLTIMPLEDRAAPASFGTAWVGPTLDDGYDPPLCGRDSTETTRPDGGPSSRETEDGYFWIGPTGSGIGFLAPDDPYSRVWW